MFGSGVKGNNLTQSDLGLATMFGVPPWGNGVMAMKFGYVRDGGFVC